MGRKLTPLEIEEISRMKRQMKSGQNVSKEELSRYSSEDMMKGRFDPNQEVANRKPLYEVEINRLKGIGQNEAAFDMQNKLNQINEKYPMKPNNNPFYDINGKLNPENAAVKRSMEITGASEPRLGPARRVWNLGEYNNTIEGQGGFAAIPELLMIEGVRHSLHVPEAGAAELPEDIQAQKDLYNKEYIRRKFGK